MNQKVNLTPIRISTYFSYYQSISVILTRIINAIIGSNYISDIHLFLNAKHYCGLSVIFSPISIN